MFDGLVAEDAPPVDKKRGPGWHPRRKPTRYDAVPNPWSLSGGQVAILRKICEGRTIVEAAAALGLSIKTVHAQLDRARDYAGVSNTMQLVLAWDRWARSQPCSS